MKIKIIIGSILVVFLIALLIFLLLAYESNTQKKKARKKTELLRIGKMIFSKFEDEFADFFNLYLHDLKKFLTQNAGLLKAFENPDLKNLEPLEILYIFADSKKLVHFIDWRGEGEENEIETFADNLLGKSHSWTNTAKLRAILNEDELRDGISIIDLLKSTDKDLQTTNQRLIFFELAWDAYVYTIIPSKTFIEVTNSLPDAFSGTDKLRK